jgi:hypothetical protein
MEKIYDMDSYYNIYFDKDKIRLVNNQLHRNPETQKAIAQIYKGKRNRKLTSLINDKNIGYFALNIDGAKYFDLVYDLLKTNSDEDGQKEIGLFVETMKIVLDEKAIAQLAPGNGIFIFNELKKKKVEYTDFEYDDDYNEKEIKKTKEISVPDFIFAFATENEGYWHRVFDAMLSNKYLGKDLVKYGDIYSFKQNPNKEIDKMFFTVRENIVYFSTSIENLSPQKLTGDYKKIAREVSKNAMYGRLDMQKFLKGFDGEIKDAKDRKSYEYFKNNVGDLIYKTNAKDKSIETEMIYQLRNSSSENSLMYIFDLFQEIYKEEEAKKVEKNY